jgi:MYXO-CTERM domain-containing protein
MGVCDGTDTKACHYPTESTACGSTCVSGIETDKQCNGKGDCVVGGARSCNNLVCTSDGTKCKATCAADTDCIDGFTCAQNGKCVPSTGANPTADGGNPTGDGGNGTNPAGQGGCGCDTSGSPPYSAGLALAAFALLFGRKGRRKTK